MKAIYCSTWQRSTPTINPFPSPPSQRSSSRTGRWMQGGVSFLLPDFSEESPCWFFFPSVPAMPVEPLGLVLCLENAATMVDLFNVMLLVKVIWAQESINMQVWLTALLVKWDRSGSVSQEILMRSLSYRDGHSHRAHKGGKCGVHILVPKEMCCSASWSFPPQSFLPDQEPLKQLRKCFSH